MGPHAYMWNAMDFPAGVLPVTTVTHDDVRAMKQYSGEMPKWMFHNIIEAKIINIYIILKVIYM